MCNRDGRPSYLAENANSYPSSLRSLKQRCVGRNVGGFREEVLRSHSSRIRHRGIVGIIKFVEIIGLAALSVLRRPRYRSSLISKCGLICEY